MTKGKLNQMDALELLTECAHKSRYCVEIAVSDEGLCMIAHGNKNTLDGFFEVEAPKMDEAIRKFAKQLFSK